MFMTFYNVDMEKAKNINDLLEEYERMEAIIDLFFKKDVENKELEELRRWLTVSINYFRRFQKVLSTLKIKMDMDWIQSFPDQKMVVQHGIIHLQTILETTEMFQILIPQHL